MKYTVIIQTNSDDLVKCVNEMIVKGWKPLGGVSMAVSGPHIGFAQAMTKEDNINERN